MSTLEWALVTLILCLGGIVKGVIGFGLPAFSIPFLALILGPRNAVVMLSISIVLTNLDNVRRDLSEWRNISRVLPYFIFGGVCVPLGVIFLQQGNPDLVRLIIGLAIYFNLVVRRYIPEMGGLGANTRRGIGAGCGFLAGFLAGMANIPAPVSIVYFTMFDISKNTFIFLVNAFNTLTIGVAVTTFALSGEYTPATLSRASVALIPVYIGFWVGFRLREKLSQEKFFRFVRWGLFGIASVLILRSIWKFIY